MLVGLRRIVKFLVIRCSVALNGSKRRNAGAESRSERTAIFRANPEQQSRFIGKIVDLLGCDENGASLAVQKLVQSSVLTPSPITPRTVLRSPPQTSSSQTQRPILSP